MRNVCGGFAPAISRTQAAACNPAISAFSSSPSTFMPASIFSPGTVTKDSRRVFVLHADRSPADHVLAEEVAQGINIPGAYFDPSKPL